MNIVSSLKALKETFTPSSKPVSLPSSAKAATGEEAKVRSKHGFVFLVPLCFDSTLHAVIKVITHARAKIVPTMEVCSATAYSISVPSGRPWW